ncbi:hypothetical protein [Laribacter hongkongensis]|uniref:hypothetical protein n=1 Tax=Laribacter hongkongensis TaxID=168471 RepID=UPI000B59FB05|nr:hypothetical protein [Laribacter hongkongensis]MCG9042103.1 hypothetical protein [Laribacter hongkongensis]MCG9068553.1 hypothetical protein [Laribacter hongkongensis]MCG9088031.1 hypothetical protein [Laribacter hongkongensis]MCG9110593.1 hypothetical protein [Laribacter hongkongensis]MCG9122328.1 hypothetical protein [Laribacter hongkongensis]
MKIGNHGPSLYYASDKNVFDALNQHKVDIPTIMKLLERRNIVVSKKTPRESLATYFSRQTHDYQDHKDIAARLGIAPRRERITSMDVNGEVTKDHLDIAVKQLKEDLESHGEVVQIHKENGKISLTVQYSTVDYKVSEFAQRQERDGTIELLETEDGCTIRNTHNEFVNDVTQSLIKKLEVAADAKLQKVTISLFGVPVARLRSKFFHELASSLPGYTRTDVTSVYVFKAKQDALESDDSDEDADEGVETETYVERVALRGNGVTRSDIFNDLLEEDDYYITKIAWEARETAGAGHTYIIEATFANPKDCTGFSFILSGVYSCEDGRLSNRRRAPFKHEIEKISSVVEARARELVKQLNDEFSLPSGDADAA